MSHNSGSELPAVPVAIIGKSPLFPACPSGKIFWPNVLGLDGVMVGLATGQWPFSEFFTEQDLKNLKTFVMGSGLLTGDGLPADGFEFPPEVLKISDVLPVLALFLARLSLEECQAFKDGKVPGESVRVILGSAADGHATAKKLAGMLKKQFGFTVSPPDSKAPVTGTCSLLARAVRELQDRAANLAIVGWTDIPNPVFASLDALQPATAGATERTLTEGIGMVLLRRLEDATRDGDRILAVIAAADPSSLTVRVESATTERGLSGLGTTDRARPDPAAPGTPAASAPALVSSAAGVSLPDPDASHPASQPASPPPFGVGAILTELLPEADPEVREIPWTLRLEEIPWVRDHCPNYVIPALPLMYSLDWLARLIEQAGHVMTGIPRLEATHWIAFDQPVIHGVIRLRATAPDAWRADLRIERDGVSSRAVTASFTTGAAFPAPISTMFPALVEPEEQPLPYQTCDVPHGESFQLLQRWILGRNGASSVVNNAARGVPVGHLNPAMLDAVLHTIPWTRLERWFPHLPAGCVGYPVALEQMRLFGQVPREGTTEVEVRVLDGKGLPRVGFRLFHRGTCYAAFDLTAYVLPLGRFAPLSPAKRRAFFRDGRYVQGAAIAVPGAEESRLELADLHGIDWLPTTVSRLYRREGEGLALARQVVLADHLAQFARLHPADIAYDAVAGLCRNLPFNPVTVTLEETPDRVIARGALSPSLDWKRVRDCWVKWTGGQRRFFHDLLGLLFGTFVNRVVLHRPAEFEAVASRPVIYLANHQIGLESPLFMTLAYALTGLPIQAVAKPDHVNGWLDFLLTFAADSLGDNHPFRLMYFDRLKPQGLIDSLKKGSGQNDSLLVHIEGTRAMAAGQPVTRISSIFLDMAIEKNIPMVPVRFVGGLPQKQIAERLDFPYGNGKQDYILGAPILPEALKKLPYGQRPRFVLDRINSLGPLNDEDAPLPPSKKFEEKTAFFMKNFAFPKMQAMLFAILGFIDDPCEETGFLLKMVQSGKLDGKTPGMPPTLGKFLMHVKTKFT